jgi:hypothetical protein
MMGILSERMKKDFLWKIKDHRDFSLMIKYQQDFLREIKQHPGLTV